MKYAYSGSVSSFGEVINHYWEAKTTADTIGRARVNFAFQYKKEFNKSVDYKIKLNGIIKEI